MKRISRRDFLGKSALGLGSAFIAAKFPYYSEAGPFPGSSGMAIGFQVWTIKDQLIKDFAGTLKMMADMGYNSLEMCSPPGYESSGFGPLMKLPAKEMKKIIKGAGMKCESCHYQMKELRENLDQRIEFAKQLGLKQMILASFGLPGNATLRDWQNAADQLNNIGVKVKKAGLQMGFHNHHMEFQNLGGNLIYDVLLNEFDPEYIKMQFQVAVISIGYKASDYFTKYPGRFISAHIADWSDKENKMVPAGKGIVDWNEFFSTLKTGGVKNVFVEMDKETFKESAIFLKSRL